MQQPYILGIDIGTGSTKAVAVNFSGEAFLSTQQLYETQHPKQGYSEQDPARIWEAFVHCVHGMFQQLAEPPACISLSSAMHSVIVVDAQGNALYPMITWADGRSASIAEALKNSP